MEWMFRYGLCQAVAHAGAFECVERKRAGAKNNISGCGKKRE